MKNFDRIAIVTSSQSWFVPFARGFADQLMKSGYHAELFHDHKDIPEGFQVSFLLSYYRIVEKKYLEMRRHNLVVHESALPKGRGWAPLFWQILEGVNKIPVCLIEAAEKMDEGDIYLKDDITYEGHELRGDLREKQALKTIDLCIRFLDEYENLKPVKQKGKVTCYKKRTPADSELDVNKSLIEQFNLMRTANNDEFPAFFRYNGHKYIIKIFKSK